MGKCDFTYFADRLSQIFLFKGVSAEEIDTSTPFFAECSILTFIPDQIIADARKPIDGLALLCDGEAAVLSDSSPKAVPLRGATVGDVFGAASLYSSDWRYETLVRAITECRLLRIPADTVKMLIAHHPIIAENFIRFLSDRICFLNRKITAFTVDSAEAKLAVYLSQCPRTADGEITVSGSLTSLADSLGMGRASLYRALSKFEEMDILAREGKEWRIKDYRALVSVFRTDN